ncbi:MAG: SOUL family heme-binding protein [Geminicoccaceae bacterium]
MRNPVLAVLGSLALGACSVVGIRSGTEEPAYQVVALLEQGVEIRRYGPRLAAETTVEGAATDDWHARSAAFKRLAGFIFGDNRPQAKIAMTAPVQVAAGSAKIAMTAAVATAAGPDGLTMRFFMPGSYRKETLPEPNDPRVQIVEVPGEDLAVLRFTSSTGATAVAAREAELARVLEASPWRLVGRPVALFYDPPWTLPFLRRNEVAVAVERRGDVP